MRLGQKTWLSSGAAAVAPALLEQEGTEAVDNGADTAALVEVEHSVTAAVGLDADTADLAELEPSVIERLGDMIFKCVRKTAWSPVTYPAISALKQARMALAEATKAAAKEKPPVHEPTEGSAAAGEPASESTRADATAAPTSTTRTEATVPEDDDMVADGAAPSECCEGASAPGKAKAQVMRKPNINDIVRLSVQRNKKSYDGYEARAIALLTRGVKAVQLDGPEKGEEN